MNSQNHILRALAVAAVIAGTALPAAADPYDYLDHRDTITSSAGNANAANMAVQTIDPWPAKSKNTKTNLDGKRAQVGITRYQQNKSLDPRGLGTTTISEQSGPGSQSSTSLQK
jgi:hypothetical protein